MKLPRTLLLFRISLIFSMATLLGVVSSCSKEDDKGEDTSPLEGTWESGCKTDELFPSTSVEHIFKGNVLTIKGVIYSDEECTTKAYSMDAVANFTAGEDYGEGKKLDIASQKVFITYHDDEAVAKVNSDCGHEYFTKDKQTEVTIDACNGSYAGLMEPYYGIYKIDDNKLYQDNDKDLDGSSEEKRPKKLDTNYITKK